MAANAATRSSGNQGEGQKMTRIKWTAEMLAAEAAKYQTRSEFVRGSKNAYQVAHRRNLLDEICGHMTGQRTSWTDEMLAAEAAKYQTRSEFWRSNEAAYAAAQNRKLLDQICGHMTGNAKWTTETLTTEAAKYQTRKEFERGNVKAYQAAKARKLLDLICSHMTAQRTDWTTETLTAEAAKYQTRSAFERGNEAAYQAAKRHEILDEICGHMIDGAGSSDNDAIYIWRAVGMRFNGEKVYKIGVTSARLGNRRIKLVSRNSGIKCEMIVCQPIKCKATTLEKQLLILGVSPEYTGFDGCTEFRALTTSALEAAIAMIEREAA
jgi:hypothetical protein